MKKLILFTITTILLFNCNNEPCKDENCITNEQFNFFNKYIPDIVNKKVLFEMSSMDLSSKDISTLPRGIFTNLTNLTSVDLTDNPICNVDRINVGLADSVTLTLPPLNENCLTDEQLAFFSGHLPSSITTKKQLFDATSLDLSNKSITSLEAGIFNNLTNLTSVNLSSNNLASIPTGIGNLTKLTTLTLHNNELTSIPAEIGNLTSLTMLWLDNNDLTIIPTEIGNLTSLTFLSLFNNKLTSIPTEIGNLNKLKYLWLSSNNLTSIPTDIGNLTSLTELQLSNNQLTSIPNMLFTNLTNLTNLWLHNNKLTSIPTEIGNLTNLTTLLLSSNNLTSIPAGIFTKLTNLTILRLKDSSSDTNTFNCNSTNYSTWGLNPTSLPSTEFLCNN